MPRARTRPRSGPPRSITGSIPLCLHRLRRLAMHKSNILPTLRSEFGASCSVGPITPTGRPETSTVVLAHWAAISNREAKRPMSNTLARSCSSSGVRRSSRSVASPACRNAAATRLLRGLKRPLPLPCAKTTSPFANSGTPSNASAELVIESEVG